MCRADKDTPLRPVNVQSILRCGSSVGGAKGSASINIDETQAMVQRAVATTSLHKSEHDRKRIKPQESTRVTF